jgi:PAS domain S-box-containing protein
MRTEETFARMVLEQAPEAILIITAERNPPGPIIVYVNPAFTRLTGYWLQEVVGRSPQILEGPNTQRSCLTNWKQSRRREEPSPGAPSTTARGAKSSSRKLPSPPCAMRLDR